MFVRYHIEIRGLETEGNTNSTRDGFCYKGAHISGALCLKLILKFLRKPLDIILGAFTLFPAPIAVARRYMRNIARK